MILDSNRLFLIVLGIISGILIFFSKKVNGIILFLLLSNIVIIHSITKDLIASIAISFIVVNISICVTNFTYNKMIHVEKFEDKMDTNDTNDSDVDKSQDLENDIGKESNDKSDSGDSKDEFFIDTKGSFLENYKSLTKDQVDGLNKDTKDLIDTQKHLIETLKNMGPALKDGKQILDTFKNYFGSDKEMNDIVSKFKFGK